MSTPRSATLVKHQPFSRFTHKDWNRVLERDCNIP